MGFSSLLSGICGHSINVGSRYLVLPSKLLVMQSCALRPLLTTVFEHVFRVYSNSSLLILSLENNAGFACDLLLCSSKIEYALNAFSGLEL